MAKSKPPQPDVKPGLRIIWNLLFVDMDAQGDFINPDKEWDADMLDIIAERVCQVIPRPTRKRRLK